MLDLIGIVEDILFQNNENGYTVAKFNTTNQLHVVVGVIPYISIGQKLKLNGEWVVHKHFGQQFKIESFEEVLPNSLIGIEKYLSSGVIMGIGPVTAKKIVEKFGEKSLEILDNDIDKLTEIEGIGEKKIRIIYESYSKQREVKNIMVFLQTYGVSANQCVKIYKKYGNNSISIVQENPYILTEDITGIGFKIADKIARNLGIGKDSPFRVQSGIKYVINDFCMLGNTYIPLNKLIDAAKAVLEVPIEDIEKNIYQSTLDQKLKIEIIEEAQCVFTLPYYYCEIGVTKKLLTLAYSNYEAISLNLGDEIKKFQIENEISFADSQKEAIKGAFDNGVEIITGGPGTGKTTIIKCIIQIFEAAKLKVFMAAPTGRAAKRMTEATGREAKTIHRLLELGFNDEDELSFIKNDESPLECDVLIVDEASMIDIMLMNNLLKTVQIGTRLIIVGDVDQLPSVGPGNVLRDIIESEGIKVVRLKDIFRQAEKSMIVVNAHKINNGEMPLLNARGKDFFFIKEEDQLKVLETLLDLVNKRLPKFNNNWDKRKHIQVLSPMRKGILGVGNLNKNLQSIINPPNKNKKEKEVKDFIFRVGDKVMQMKNNYTLKWERVSGEGDKEGLGVFNGDIGYIDTIDDEDNTVTVVFDEERKIVYENLLLDELDLAYATTIHKSQGSEFKVVILPAFMGPPLLMNRNLLYTGITRAKEMVVLVGSIKAVNFMVNNNRSFERYSSLKWRIKEILKDNIIN